MIKPLLALAILTAAIGCSSAMIGWGTGYGLCTLVAVVLLALAVDELRKEV